MTKKNPAVAVDWREFTEELRFNQDRIEARLGRILEPDELEELEELDDVAAMLATDGQPTEDAFEFMER
jgi:hypothetical protein